jgi:hypothetical protein
LLLLGCGVTIAPNQPTALHVTLPPNPAAYLYPPIDKTITDIAAVQKLYAAALALPSPAPGGIEHCPAMIPGLTYHLTFLHGSTVLRKADLDGSGCQALSFSPTDYRVTNPSFLALFRQTIAN